MLIKYFWAIAAIPAGIITALIIGVWSDFIGHTVEPNMLGAFIGIVISFLIMQIIDTLLLRKD